MLRQKFIRRKRAEKMILLRRFLVVKTDLCFDILKFYDDIVFIRKTSQFFNQPNLMSHVYDKNAKKQP